MAFKSFHVNFWTSSNVSFLGLFFRSTHWIFPDSLPLPIFMLLNVLVTQSCPTLCDPIDYSPAGSSVYGILWVRILEYSLTPFPSPGDLSHPGIEPGSLHCRQIVYRLSHQGRPRASEGSQYMPSPNMPLWHKNYFELKAFEKTAGIRRMFWPPFLF